eukprot:2819532-Amphidinium_carterae.1
MHPPKNREHKSACELLPSTCDRSAWALSATSFVPNACQTSVNPQLHYQGGAMHVFARTGRTKPSTYAAICKRHGCERLAVERQLVDNKWDFHVLGADALTLGLLT